MTYADTKPRTVTVQLPSDASVNLPTMRTCPSGDGVLIQFRIGGEWDGFRVMKSELEPLALALLAHHYANHPTPPERNSACACTK